MFDILKDKLLLVGYGLYFVVSIIGALFLYWYTGHFIVASAGVFPATVIGMGFWAGVSIVLSGAVLWAMKWKRMM